MLNRIAPLLLVAAALGCTTPSRPPPPTPPASTMRMHVIDIGEGVSVLFEFADGAVLVDTGGEDNSAFHSDEKLGAYLDAFFACRPDLHGQLASLILTHPHLDHTRGVPVVLAHHPPRNVVTNGQTAGSGAEQQNALRQYAIEHQGSVGLRGVHLEEILPRGQTDDVIDREVTCRQVGVRWRRDLR